MLGLGLGLGLELGLGLGLELGLGLGLGSGLGLGLGPSRQNVCKSSSRIGRLTARQLGISRYMLWKEKE